jgi:hypothetical protein
MTILESLGLRRSPRNHRERVTTTRRKNTGLSRLFHHKKRANKSAGFKVFSQSYVNVLALTIP